MIPLRSTERRAQISAILNHGTGCPMRVIGVFAPVDAMSIHEQTGPRAAKEFVDLTADVPQVNVSEVRISHGRGSAAAEIDEDVGSAQISMFYLSRPLKTQLVNARRDSTLVQHYMWREYELILVM